MKIKEYVCNIYINKELIKSYFIIYGNKWKDQYKIVKMFNKKFENNNIKLEYKYYQEYSNNKYVDLFDDVEELIQYQIYLIEAISYKDVIKKLNLKTY